MTDVLQIQRAIERLDSEELSELSQWWNSHIAQKGRGAVRSPDGIGMTSGCLAGSDGEEFAAAVAAAGKDTIKG